MKNSIDKKYRVRASVYPTNRIILTEHGIRQVAFPYDLYTLSYNINLSVRFGKKEIIEIW